MSVSQAWGMMSGTVGTLTTIAIADGMCCVVLCAVFFSAIALLLGIT